MRTRLAHHNLPYSAIFFSQHVALSTRAKAGTKFGYECSPISSIDAEKTILER